MRCDKIINLYYFINLLIKTLSHRVTVTETETQYLRLTESVSDYEVIFADKSISASHSTLKTQITN